LRAPVFFSAAVVLSSLLVTSNANAVAVSNPSQTPGSRTAGNAEPTAIVAEVRRLIAEHYVLPERRPVIDAALAKGLQSGRYAVREPGLLAERITADLARASRDHHLYFRYDPQRVAAMSVRPAKDLPPVAMLDEARRANHGIRELKLLPGNVRYLDLSSFEWVGEESEAAIDAAVAFLKGGEAVIIDLRRNGGGSGRAVHQWISHFLPADRPLITFYKGAEKSPTMRSLPGLSSMVGKPLYVLTSRGTGSAAEEFVGHVAGYKLGEVVGAPTSGAAYMNNMFPIDGRFELSISVARPVLAATGKDWERTGIAPTIEVPFEQALERAHVHAVRQLAAKADAARSGRLEELAKALEAVARPAKPAAPLEVYAGTFGDRRVVIDGGKLWYHQEERPRRLMVALGGHRFTLGDEPLLRLNFDVVGNRAKGFDLGLAQAPIQGRFERTS
jgi:hypothetical protein